MFTVIGQAIDYIVKALVSYRQTEQGAIEWQQVVDAWAEVRRLG